MALCTAGDIASQCLMDRHNTSLASHWMSCTTSQNPNSVRGMSHWLLMEFDEFKGIGEIKMWNMNHPDYLDNGINEVAIDVSYDGVTWTELYTGSLSQGQSMSNYEGDLVVNLGGAAAKFMVITSLANYGGGCHGLAEIKVNMADFPCINDIVNIPDNPVPTGVYSANLILNSTGTVQNNEVWMFGGNEVCLESGFEVEIGSVFTASNNPCQ